MLADHARHLVEQRLHLLLTGRQLRQRQFGAIRCVGHHLYRHIASGVLFFQADGHDPLVEVEILIKRQAQFAIDRYLARHFLAVGCNPGKGEAAALTILRIGQIKPQSGVTKLPFGKGLHLAVEGAVLQIQHRLSQRQPWQQERGQQTLAHSHGHSISTGHSTSFCIMH